jgi:hypothetical protein
MRGLEPPRGLPHCGLNAARLLYTTPANRTDDRIRTCKLRVLSAPPHHWERRQTGNPLRNRTPSPPGWSRGRDHLARVMKPERRGISTRELSRYRSVRVEVTGIEPAAPCLQSTSSTLLFHLEIGRESWRRTQRPWLPGPARLTVAYRESQDPCLDHFTQTLSYLSVRPAGLEPAIFSMSRR